MCRWLEGIRDWCISRQLWWGHRIPAWYVCLEGDVDSVAGTMSEHLDRSSFVPCPLEEFSAALQWGVPSDRKMQTPLCSPQPGHWRSMWGWVPCAGLIEDISSRQGCSGTQVGGGIRC